MSETANYNVDLKFKMNNLIWSLIVWFSLCLIIKLHLGQVVCKNNVTFFFREPKVHAADRCFKIMIFFLLLLFFLTRYN